MGLQTGGLLLKSAKFTPTTKKSEKVAFTTTDGETVAFYPSFFSSISRDGSKTATVTLIDHEELKVHDHVAEKLIEELFKT